MYFASFECQIAHIDEVQKKLGDAEVSFVIEADGDKALFQLTHSSRDFLGAILSTLPGAGKREVELFSLDSMDDGWSEKPLDQVSFQHLKLRVVNQDTMSKGHGLSTHLMISNSQKVFGDGCHETTRILLQELEARVVARAFSLESLRVLDLGCGNGVLGLALLYLLKRQSSARACQLLGVDICPKAVKLAQETARANGFEKFSVFTTLLPSQLDFDLVLCNIQPPFIFDLLPAIAASLEKPHARLILSGFTKFDRGLVFYKLRQHEIEVLEEKDSRGWMVCLCQKRRLSKMT